MAKLIYWLAILLLGIAVDWMIDDSYASGFAKKDTLLSEAWADGFTRGAKSVDVLRQSEGS